MRRARLLLSIGAASVLTITACSSDGDTGGSTTTSTSTPDSVSDVTTTTVAVDSTTTTTTAVDASSTTIAGRNVSDPSDSVKLGDTGEGVNQIQYVLVANGYSLPVDGQFGPVTDAAVRDFQAKQGLTVDGVVGPITWAALAKTVGQTPSTTTATTTASSASSTSTTTG